MKAHALLAALAASSCSFAVRLHAGPVLDGSQVGFETGVLVCTGPGVGRDDQALLVGVGVAAGTAPDIGFEAAVDAAWAVGHPNAGRVGLDLAEDSDVLRVHAHGAWLHQVWEAWPFYVGAEGGLGFATHDRSATSSHSDLSVKGGVTLDVIAPSEWEAGSIFNSLRH